MRGVWVAENTRHGNPPPPEDVPAVEPDIRGAKSIRERLLKYCEVNLVQLATAKLITPAAPEHDPVGLWRGKYGTSKQAAKVNPAGTVPTGEKFNDIFQWKKITAENPTY